MSKSAARWLRARWRGGNRGSAAIEFALISPVLLILLVGLVEIGFGAYQAMQVQDAAEAGALYAMKNGWDPAGISAAVVNATGASGVTATPAPEQFYGCPEAGGAITPVTPDATCPNGDPPGQYVRVSASLPHETILPYLDLPLPAVLTGHAIVRVQ